VLALWFSATAVLPALEAQVGLDPTVASLFSSAVQLGFVAGTLVIAFLGLADQFDPRKLFMRSAGAAALANAAILVIDPVSAIVIALRFVTIGTGQDNGPAATLRLTNPGARPGLNSIITWAARQPPYRSEPSDSEHSGDLPHQPPFMPLSLARVRTCDLKTPSGWSSSNFLKVPMATSRRESSRRSLSEYKESTFCCHALIARSLRWSYSPRPHTDATNMIRNVEGHYGTGGAGRRQSPGDRDGISRRCPKATLGRARQFRHSVLFPWEGFHVRFPNRWLAG
jgi:hypothetical protein